MISKVEFWALYGSCSCAFEHIIMTLKHDVRPCGKRKKWDPTENGFNYLIGPLTSNNSQIDKIIIWWWHQQWHQCAEYYAPIKPSYSIIFVTN